MYAFINMTHLKCIILFYMNVNPGIFIIINSIHFIYLSLVYHLYNKALYVYVSYIWPNGWTLNGMIFFRELIGSPGVT